MKPYTKTSRFKKLAKEYLKEMDKTFPVKRKYTKSKRQNRDFKPCQDAPKDKNGGFWNSDDIRHWHGCLATAKAPNLF